MSHALLRILMAMYLVIWSPALCCCGIKAALGTVSGVKVALCGETAPVAMPAEASGCCAKKAVNAMSVAIPTSLPAGGAGDKPSPCRCHESVESKSRLDTGAKVTLPAVPLAEFAVIAPAVCDVRVTESLIITKPAVGFDLPPPWLSTLLAQRCLLLI
jgi:hypothetical protein